MYEDSWLIALKGIGPKLPQYVLCLTSLTLSSFGQIVLGVGGCYGIKYTGGIFPC